MSAHTPQWTAETSAFQSFHRDDGFAPGELISGERIGPRHTGIGRKAKLRAALFTSILLGGGWAVLGTPENMTGWLSALTGALSSAMERSSPRPSEPVAPPAAPEAPAANLQPLASSEIAEAPGAPPAPAAAPKTEAATSPEAEAAPGTPLPPPVVDPANRYQKRALAAGLHPDLSRVLLAKLTPADYRNASIAIQSALAETPDSASFVWPRQRNPDLALFEVHFVPGAAPDCRRYVVTVTKDGWLTTALPMEKCGAEAGRSRRG